MSDSVDKNAARGLDTDFGIFYPVGYLVAGFPEPGQAEQVQRDLLAGGYDPKDCVLYSAGQVESASRHNLEQNTGFFARLGRSDEAVRVHLDAAKKGATFLLIYAPGDLESSRAMNVVRRVPFVFVHRYHRLAMEEMY